jgi:hypothetical protein
MSKCRLLWVVLACLIAPRQDISYGQWVQAGLESYSVTALASSRNSTGDTILFAGTSNSGVFRSTNNGSSWVPVNNGLTRPWVIALLVSETNLFAMTHVSPGDAGVSVFRSTNHGTSWVETNLAVVAPSNYGYCLAASPNGSGSINLFAGTNREIYRTTNNGVDWTALGIPFSGYIWTLATGTGPDSGTSLYAGNGNEAFPFGRVYLSTDQGTNWTWISPPMHMVYAIALAPDGAGGTNLFAGTWIQGAYLSTNNGGNWTAVNTGIIPDSVNDIDINAFVVTGTNIFVGSCYSGVYLWNNGGRSWTDVNDGLGNRYIRALAFSNSHLFAAGTQGGLWRRLVAEMITSVRDRLVDMPTQFCLDQNYPNPFNPSTIIAYELPVATHVRLSVYDVLGREARTLVNESQVAGKYTVEFAATGLASGLYLYRITAGAFVQTRKLLLLR